MDILITGGSGLIGSYLVKELLKDHNVTIFDKNSPKDIKKVNFIKGDLRKENDFKKIPKVDVVFHLAAQISVPFSILNPKIDAEINIFGTINLLNWCRKNEIEKIIYSSSAAIYGEPKYLPIDENHPTEPISPYGISKLSAEKYIGLFKGSVILRYSNLIPMFISQIKKEGILNIFGNGNQTRDFVSINDIIKANLLALKYNKKGVFNVGSGKETTINELSCIIKKFKKNLKIINLPEREGEIYRSYYDISKIKKELNFSPNMDLEKEIKSTLS